METTFQEIVASQRLAQCVECERVFDLLVEDDCSEWFYGHDCEAA